MNKHHRLPPPPPPSSKLEAVTSGGEPRRMHLPVKRPPPPGNPPLSAKKEYAELYPKSTSSTEEEEIKVWLTSINLNKYTCAMIELGVNSVDDMSDLVVSDLKDELGMDTEEVNRFLAAVIHHEQFSKAHGDGGGGGEKINKKEKLRRMSQIIKIQQDLKKIEAMDI